MLDLYLSIVSISASPSTSNSESPVSQDNPHIPLRPTRSGSASHSKAKYQNLSSFKVKLSFRKGHSNEEKAMDESDHTVGKENCSRCTFVCIIFIWFTIHYMNMFSIYIFIYFWGN